MRKEVFVLGMILMFLPSLASAQINLTISPEDTLFNIPNMLPGTCFSEQINLSNTGDIAMEEILFFANFTNNCTPIEPNGFCNLTGAEPRLTDVLDVDVIYDGGLIAQKTITELGTGIFLGPLSIGETKLLKLDICFGESVGNTYQATSAETDFIFYTGAPIYGSSIVINEIMYNPSNEQGGDDYSEWIEIFNPTNESINLNSWELCGKKLLAGYINYTGGNTGDGPYLDKGMILLPKQYAIITDGKSGTKVYRYFDVSNNSLALHVNSGTLCKGTRGLKNSGETISLTDDLGNLIDSITYGDNWVADGNNKTLERKDCLGNSNSSDNWGESIPDGGTPGRLNSVVLWISDVSVSTMGDLVYVTANITHYFNLLNAEVLFSEESNTHNYTVALSTTDNQIYNATWNTSKIGSGKYILYIPARDIRLNQRLFDSDINIIKNSPPRVVPAGGYKAGHHSDSKKSYLTITPTGATMKQNETRNFTIEIRNVGNRDIKKFEVFATDSEVENWISITPSKEKLGVGEIKFWTMTISVPEDAEIGTKYFTIHANGDELNLSTNFTLTIAKKPEIFVKEEKPEIPENLTGLVPSNLTITINDRDKTTDSRNVTLTLFAENATECRLNNDGINWSNWFSYTTTRDWTLSEAPGTKTVYFQCRNEFGNSTIVYDTINYVVPETTLPTGYAILTNPAILTAIIGGILTAILGILLYKKNLD